MLVFGALFGSILYIAAGIATCMGLSTHVQKNTKNPSDRPQN